MKLKTPFAIYFSSTIVLLLVVILTVVYGYKASPVPPEKQKIPVRVAKVVATESAAKKMVAGAACCKISFSRAQILASKNPHGPSGAEKKK